MNAKLHSHRIHPQLPIFELRGNGTAAIYVPGYVFAMPDKETGALTSVFQKVVPASPQLAEIATQLETYALAATTAWQELRDRPFEPLCLTIYPSNQCQLGCIYCYAVGPHGQRGPGRGSGRVSSISLRMVEGAARTVAENCKRRRKPFDLVLHGGGEPTLHWNVLKRIVAVVKRIAKSCDLTLRSYISTNGVISTDQARWLGLHIDHISLSTDCVPEIQNTQRPFLDGRPTSENVERTASVLRSIGARFSVRCTVTHDTVHRQVEMLTAMNARFGVREFYFEPVYRSHGKEGCALNTAADAACFVDHLLAAQQIAKALDCELQYSGVRLDEIHGPYCNVLRDVLQLTPDGAAMSCFISTGSTGGMNAACQIGRWDPAKGTFQFDQSRIHTLQERTTEIPRQCHNCHNIYHCARECPDKCPVHANTAFAPVGGFRCQVQRQLSCAWILDAANVSSRRSTVSIPLKETQDAAQCLSRIPKSLSAVALANKWLLASGRHISTLRRAPDPIWAIRGYDIDGSDAWREISKHIMTRVPQSPMCIYIHVPFCDRKCGFCDCYAFPLKTQHGMHMQHYVKALQNEIRAWASLSTLTQRPVTTVHFGGGTPTILQAKDMRETINSLKCNFKVNSLTELALESTSSHITPESLELFRELGITRLHVGVQSLDNQVRQQAGRKDSASTVEDKLRAALKMGMVVTVDVIYGLPGQTISGFVDTLRRLDSLGIHGVSLYRLNLTAHNRSFVQRHALADRSLVELWFFLQVGETLLRSWNYRKTHFAHFSRPLDRYLYYRHTRRGEDLLALGPSADGVFGRIHYRHHDLGEYMRRSNSCSPALCGAVSESVTESRLQPAVASVMTASCSAKEFEELGASALLASWEREGLVAYDHLESAFVLTANGSWFISDMLGELESAGGGGTD